MKTYPAGIVAASLVLLSAVACQDGGRSPGEPQPPQPQPQPKPPFNPTVIKTVHTLVNRNYEVRHANNGDTLEWDPGSGVPSNFRFQIVFDGQSPCKGGAVPEGTNTSPATCIADTSGNNGQTAYSYWVRDLNDTGTGPRPAGGKGDRPPHKGKSKSKPGPIEDSQAHPCTGCYVNVGP